MNQQNTGQQPYVEYDDEIDLADYIRVLIKRKWLIAIGTLLCLMGGLVYAKTQKQPYEARASLLVIPPPYKTELAPPTFSMGVYEELAQAQDLKQAIIDSLALVNNDGRRLSIPGLSGLLKTESVQADARAQAGPGSSLMHLVVTTVDTAGLPPVAIANAWAALFVQKNSGISLQETGGSYEFIREQYEIARDNLQAAEDSLIAFNRRYHIDVLKTELAPTQAKLSDYQTSAIALALELNNLEETLGALARQLQAIETSRGQWVGSLDVTGYGGIDRAALDADQRRILDSAVRARDAFVVLRDEVREKELAYALGLMSEDLRGKRDALVRYRNELSSIRVDESSISQILSELRERGGNRFVDGAVVETLPADALREVMSLRMDYNLLTPRQRHLLIEQVRLNAEVDSLEAIFSRNQLALTQVKDQFATAQAVYEALAGRYRETKIQIDNARIAIQTLRPQVSHQERERQRLANRAEVLTAQIANLELERARLARNIAVFKSTFDKFAALLEDARVAKASQPSDVKLVAQAVEAVPISSRMPIALVAAAVGLMGMVFFAFVLEYVQKAREGMEG